MSLQALLNEFTLIAENPAKQKDQYIKQGKKIVLTAPIYTPEEIVHAMGAVPFGAWGADIELADSKKYFPAFLCAYVQSIVELGMKGVYEGASAIIIPSLTDTLKVLGQNWKYAVPHIPFIPMTYPQNRDKSFAVAYTMENYKRVIADLESATGLTYSEEKLSKSIEVYNEHNKVMRELTDVLASYPQVTVKQRSDIFKSAFFMLKEEHTAMVKKLLEALATETKGNEKTKVYISGILADAPSLCETFDDLGMQVVGDDVAAQSRQYRTDAPNMANSLEGLAVKFCDMDNCSVLYDVEKKRVDLIVREAKAKNASGVIILLTKFCDSEEFDYPLIKKACEAAKLPILLIEVDRQMVDYQQAKTMLETFKDMM